MTGVQTCALPIYYQPSTVLLSELEPGKRYELVITNFKGGAFVRYRVGDMIRVLSLNNNSLNIGLPQIIYEDRIDDVIDLAGFTRINERTIWEALKRADITHGNWAACKAFAGAHPIVQLYMEMPPFYDNKAHNILEDKINGALCSVDTDYNTLTEMMAYRPLKLVPVAGEAFKMIRQKQSAGQSAPIADRRINPSKITLQDLVNFRVS